MFGWNLLTGFLAGFEVNADCAGSDAWTPLANCRKGGLIFGLFVSALGRFPEVLDIGKIAEPSGGEF